MCGCRIFRKRIKLWVKSGSEQNDLALIWSEKECTAAAVYTTNKVRVHPSL